MTIETLNAIKDEAINLDSSLTALDAKLTEAEIGGAEIPAAVDEALANLALNLNTVHMWVQQAIINGMEGGNE